MVGILSKEQWEYILEKKYGPLTRRNSIKWEQKKRVPPPQFTVKAHQPKETCDFSQKLT